MDFLVEPFAVDPGKFDGPVLVTGAGGCLGAWTLAILEKSGIPAVACDLSDSRARPALVMGEEKAAALTWELCDISDAERLIAIVSEHGIRAIIHYAGLQVPFCKQDPALGARVNVEGTVNVLLAAREADIKRTAYASSVAAHGMPTGGEYMATLYGVYKVANEESAKVFWQDWGVPSVGIRPNVVYGIARDQGISAKGTIAIQSAVLGKPYDIPFSGKASWLYAGEAAAAFIAAVSSDGEGAPVFDLNGSCAEVGHAISLIGSLQPGAEITCSGEPFPFPADMDDEPMRRHVGGYPVISIEDGIRATHEAFVQLAHENRMPELPA